MRRRGNYLLNVITNYSSVKPNPVVLPPMRKYHVISRVCRSNLDKPGDIFHRLKTILLFYDRSKKTRT